MKNLVMCSLLLLCNLYVHAQNPGTETFTISGYIREANSGEELLYANVFAKEANVGTTSNLYGFYSISLPKGKYQLSFSYIGYETTLQEIDLTKDVELNVSLIAESEMLEEVVVTDKKEDEAIQDVSMSKIDLPIAQMKKLPALMGEPDLIKTVQTLPGVISAGEGTSSFFVRGGAADQNLILIDEAPVYDVSHLFGLFSVFNADIIKSAELYKGGIPSKYGGRLSSLLEVTTKDGNVKQFEGNGGIGLLAAKMTLQGPIVKDKASFIVSARRSYADLFMPYINAFDNGTSIQFYDLNAKLNWKKDNNDRFFLSAYSGRDVWHFGDNFGMNWGNTTTTFRWNHLFNDKLFSNLSLIYSNFDYALEDTDEADGLEWKANQEEFSIKEDISWFMSPQLTFNFGYQGIYRRFNSGDITPNSPASIFVATKMQPQYALDHGLYLGAEHKVTEKLTLRYGLRYSIFQNIGAGTVYEYEDLGNTNEVVVTDSTVYGDWENIETFHNLEPRFSARYLLDKESSIKLSYNRMVQYIHLVSNSTVPIPFNTWSPSGPYLAPQKADQVAIGYFRNFEDNMYEFSLEAYYKESKDLTEFADNADLFFNPHIANEFRQGNSTSYGIEAYVRKTKGKLTGFASYTWSKTDMNVEGINFDQTYPANHDRRHNLNIALTYELNDQWNIGGNFTYATGRPITLPTAKYEFDNYQVNYYSGRNGYRLPDFHRLDLSATYEPRSNKDKRFKQSLVFGVYNAYNQQNPFTIYTRKTQDDDGNIVGDGTSKEARMVYLFGALPYFTWNFSF